jgi:hypothetical protein
MGALYLTVCRSTGQQNNAVLETSGDRNLTYKVVRSSLYIRKGLLLLQLGLSLNTKNKFKNKFQQFIAHKEEKNCAAKSSMSQPQPDSFRLILHFISD